MIGTSKSIWGFDPRSIPNCIVWLDGGDSNTMTPSTPSGGTQITAWLDKSVNGVSYVSGAVPTYAGCNITPPTYVAGGGINFNPSIPGGGTFTNNVTQGLTAVGGFPLNATGFTAFAVAVATGTMTTFNSYFSYFTGGAEFIDFDAGGGTFGQITTDTTGLNVNISGTRLTTTRQIQSVRSSTTGANFFVNGSLSNSSVFNYTQVNNPVATVVWIGNQAPGFRSFSGTIFELLVYDQSLSSNQRQTVEGYLARKWAITLATTHPFFVLPPFNRYFNPNDIPGCSLWLDAADNSTMNSTTTVTSWLDKSGLNNTMTGTATWTGTTMSFNGSTQAFSNTGYVFPISAYSMFGVYSNTTAPTAAAYMNAVYGSNGFPMLGTFDTARAVTARSVVANTGALSVPVGWAARIGSTAGDIGYGIAADPSGNVLVTGTYSAALTVFNQGPSGTAGTTLPFTANSETFVAKYSSAGAVLWAARITGSTSVGNIGYGIATDTSGAVVVTGYYSASLTVFNQGPSGTAGTTLPFTGGQDAFVAKYSSAGAVLWAARIAGTGVNFEAGRGIATDTSGNVLVIGNYSTGTVTIFNQGPSGTAGTTLLNAGGQDAFVAKYSSAGAVLWAARIASTGNENGYGIATDTSGNVLVTGNYSAALTIYNQGPSGTAGTTLPFSGSGADCFVAKYSSAGAVLWAARIASTSADVGWAIATDPSGNVLVTGSYNAALTVFNQGPTGTAGTTLTFAGGQDVFVAKYSPDGAVLWAARIAGTINDVGYGIATDTSGNVVVTGSYNAAVTAFNQGPSGSGVVTLSFSGGQDTFVAKYSSAGAVLWATRIAASGNDIGRGIATDTSGNVLVTGNYSTATVTIFNQGGTTGTTLPVVGGDDCFVVKYTPDGFINPPVPASSNVLVSATYAPSTFSPFVDGCNAITLAGTTLATTGIFVGGPSNYFNGTISELLIYSANLSAAQRQQVEGYLIDKWSLRSQTVSNHQYRLIPPATSQPPQYTEVTPGNWVRDWQPELRSLVAANASGVTLTGSNITGGATYTTNGWFGGTVGPDGNIYFSPFAATNILRLNVATGVTTNITGGATYTASGWRGGVLGPDGNIYFTPFAAANILRLNVATGVTTNITGGATYTANGWIGGALGPDGNIYFMPFAATNILRLNVATGVTTNITGGATYTASGWAGTILGPDGNIYGTPYNAANILRLNVATGVTTNITGGATYTTAGWQGQTLGQDGNIYFAPTSATNVLRFNVATGVTTNITGGATLTANATRQNVLGPDGNIYFTPHVGSFILQLNVSTGVISSLTPSGITYNGSGGWQGSILGPDGNIYFSPWAAGNILKLTFSGLSQLPSSNYCLSAYANKY